MTTTIKAFPLQVGQRATFARTFTEADIVNYVGVSWDYNPAHTDAEYAKATRFGRRIAHGLLVASMFSALLGTQLPGPRAIYLGQNLKFVAPVFIGDTIEAMVQVVDIRRDKPVVTLATIACNQEGNIVIEGEATMYVVEKGDDFGDGSNREDSI